MPSRILICRVTDRAERAERIRLLTEMARTLVACGVDADQVAEELLRRTDSPVSAIKAVADATGMGLGDAKWVVHRNLHPEVREVAESVWDELLYGMSESPDSRGVTDSAC